MNRAEWGTEPLVVREFHGRHSRELYAAMMIETGVHPNGDQYVRSVPDARLFDVLANEWNKSRSDHEKIHTRIWDSSSEGNESRVEIIERWVEEAAWLIAKPDLTRRYDGLTMNPYGQPTPKEQVFRHDIGHLEGIVWVPGKAVSLNREVGRFWLDLEKASRGHPALNERAKKEICELSSLLDWVTDTLRYATDVELIEKLIKEMTNGGIDRVEAFLRGNSEALDGLERPHFQRIPESEIEEMTRIVYRRITE